MYYCFINDYITAIAVRLNQLELISLKSLVCSFHFWFFHDIHQRVGCYLKLSTLFDILILVFILHQLQNSSFFSFYSRTFSCPFCLLLYYCYLSYLDWIYKRRKNRPPLRLILALVVTFARFSQRYLNSNLFLYDLSWYHDMNSFHNFLYPIQIVFLGQYSALP